MEFDVVTEEITVRAVPSLDELRAAATYCWRVEQLERAGYSERLAYRIADDHRIDLHLACDLLARGCPELTAFRILT